MPLSCVPPAPRAQPRRPSDGCQWVDRRETALRASPNLLRLTADREVIDVFGTQREVDTAHQLQRSHYTPPLQEFTDTPSCIPSVACHGAHAVRVPPRFWRPSPHST